MNHQKSEAIETLYQVFFNEMKAEVTMTTDKVTFKFPAGLTLEYWVTSFGMHEGTLERAMVFALQNISQRTAQDLGYQLTKFSEVANTRTTL